MHSSTLSNATRRAISLSRPKLLNDADEDVSLENKDGSNKRYHFDYGHKAIVFHKLLDEAKFAENGLEFTQKLLQTFHDTYQGDDIHKLTPIVKSLSSDSRKSKLFHFEKQFTPEFVQALAIGYIKDQMAAAFLDGKFNLSNFKQWCTNNLKTELFNNSQEYDNFIQILTATNNLPNITFNENTVICKIDKVLIHFKLNDLELNQINKIDK